ncbi:F0F1 ATP synthase subunit delta, partial [Chloroflexota bacterium]
MSASISSKRYAQAAFQIAKDSKELDKWKSNLSKIASL